MTVVEEAGASRPAGPPPAGPPPATSEQVTDVVPDPVPTEIATAVMAPDEIPTAVVPPDRSGRKPSRRAAAKPAPPDAGTPQPSETAPPPAPTAPAEAADAPTIALAPDGAEAAPTAAAAPTVDAPSEPAGATQTSSPAQTAAPPPTAVPETADTPPTNDREEPQTQTLPATMPITDLTATTANTTATGADTAAPDPEGGQEGGADGPSRRGRRRRSRRRGTAAAGADAPTQADATLDRAAADGQRQPTDAERPAASGKPASAPAASTDSDTGGTAGRPAAGGPDDQDAENGDRSAGSARTRARRRRRAAARARHRVGDEAEDNGSAPADATGADTQRPAPAAAALPESLAEPAAEPPAAKAPPAEGTGTGTGRRGRSRGDRNRDDRNRDGQRGTATETRERKPENGGGTKNSTTSTRLSGRGQGRSGERGRRRRPGLSEEQKRVMREHGPDKRMLVSEHDDRTQIAVVEGNSLVEHYVTSKSGHSQVGNIYLGRVQNVLPGMEAAFVDVGKGRNAVLYAGEVTYNEEDLEGEAPRIERALKPGQSVLVQVTKDPIGSKGARLTTEISLAGRYLVLQPEGNTFGISRRLPEEERSRLRDILKEVRPKGLGLIVRTAAEGASADDLRSDLARLRTRWEQVEAKAKKASAPAVIYSEPELVVRVIRDIFSPDFVELIVDDKDLHGRVHDYLTEVAPDLIGKLQRHDGRLPLFEQYRLVEQIHKALERKVWLPSGGSIVIDRTEAMTVVDVNTGKFVGKSSSSLEETVVANNLEAADELVRQLRLRDIGGIVIIDFIDMLFEENQQKILDRLREALARDKTKSQVMEISSLGLVQMTRKRVSGGLLENFSRPCKQCEGRGIVITHDIG